MLAKLRGADSQMTSENDDLCKVEHVSLLQDSSEVLQGGTLDTMPEIWLTTGVFNETFYGATVLSFKKTLKFNPLGMGGSFGRPLAFL